MNYTMLSGSMYFTPNLFSKLELPHNLILDLSDVFLSFYDAVFPMILFTKSMRSSLNLCGLYLNRIWDLVFANEAATGFYLRVS